MDSELSKTASRQLQVRKLSGAIHQLIDWMQGIQEHYAPQSMSLSQGSYQELLPYAGKLLEEVRFVVVEEVPTPPFAVLNIPNIPALFPTRAAGLVADGLIVVSRSFEKDIGYFFELLVTHTQWVSLGPVTFLERYISELIEFDGATSLDAMRVDLRKDFERRLPFSLEAEVRRLIQN